MDTMNMCDGGSDVHCMFCCAKYEVSKFLEHSLHSERRNLVVQLSNHSQCEVVIISDCLTNHVSTHSHNVKNMCHINVHSSMYVWCVLLFEITH